VIRASTMRPKGTFRSIIPIRFPHETGASDSFARSQVLKKTVSTRSTTPSTARTRISTTKPGSKRAASMFTLRM
jgi:hypothetical protein